MLAHCRRHALLRPSTSITRRHLSSDQWLTRQYNDPYTKERFSNPAMYRSRSAFKLLEIVQNHGHGMVLRNSAIRSVIDLGAAPGGWSQVMAGFLNDGSSGTAVSADGQSGGFGLKAGGGLPEINANAEAEAEAEAETETEELVSSVSSPASPGLPSVKRKVVIAVDRLTMAPIRGVHTLKLDFLAPGSAEIISTLLRQETGSERADVILSDMAANFTGNRVADAENALEISNTVLAFAEKHLTLSQRGRYKGGALLMKYFQSPEADEFRKKRLQRMFKNVYTVKPKASRAESAEYYWLCYGFGHVPRKKVHKTPQPPRLKL
ncbi:23S ribosomal RNA methyltransferase [Peniophora sp. CONT]|nr:23S ribosomal RNA methyltransferase [Peniophora sp. CONT]